MADQLRDVAPREADLNKALKEPDKLIADEGKVLSNAGVGCEEVSRLARGVCNYVETKS